MEKKYHVIYIIESPSAKDLHSSHCEGYLLTAGLRLIDMPYEYHLTADELTFRSAIKKLKSVTQNKIPFLHISAHGDENGIQLTDKTFIEWNKLKEILIPINDAMNGYLCMNIASCSGFHASKMAWNILGQLPFYCLIGPTKEIPLADMAIGYIVFYHNFFIKNVPGFKALEAMKVASRNNNFELILAQDARNIWFGRMLKDIRSLLQ